MHLKLTASGSLQTLQTLRRYTGQVRDATLMLTCHNARYYDLGAGQFVSADPAGDGLRLYAYVKGNPETC